MRLPSSSFQICQGIRIFHTQKLDQIIYDLVLFRFRVRISMGLFLLMVALWMTDSISLLTEQSLLTWVIADTVNILTGLTIFVIFACKKQVWQALRNRWPHCCFLGRPPSRRPIFPKSQISEMPSVPSLCDNTGSRFIIYNSKIFRQSELAGEFSSTSQGDLPSSYNSNSSDNLDLEEDIEIDVDLWNVDLDAIQVDTSRGSRPIDEREHVIV